jgi:hypothetical protein
VKNRFRYFVGGAVRLLCLLGLYQIPWNLLPNPVFTRTVQWGISLRIFFTVAVALIAIHALFKSSRQRAYVALGSILIYTLVVVFDTFGASVNISNIVLLCVAFAGSHLLGAAFDALLSRWVGS